MRIIYWLFLCAVITVVLALIWKCAAELFKKLWGRIEHFDNSVNEKLRSAHGVIQMIQRWTKYKDPGTLWTIALILAVVLTIYLGSYALFLTDIQESAPLENSITEVTPSSVADEGTETSQSHSFWNSAMDISLYGVQTVLGILDGDSSSLNILPDNLQWLGWLVSWLIPFLTVSTAVTLLLGFLPKLLEKKEEYLIFPQTEENSLLLAEDMMKQKDEPEKIRKDRMAIFLRVDEEKLTQECKDRMHRIRAKRYPYTEADLLRIHRRLRRAKLRFFFLSADTEQNFLRMQTLIQDVKKDRLFVNVPLRKWLFRRSKQDIHEEDRGVFRQELYLLSESESSSMLIDYLRKQMCTSKEQGKKYERLPVFEHTELRLLDRYRTIMYDLMKKKPLYETAHKANGTKHIRVLILGFGRVGKAFYRTAASFCSMKGYQTTFTVRDQNMDQEWELLKLDYPECEKVADINKGPMNVMSLQVEDLVRRKEQKSKPFTYIVLSLGDDERNIKVASRLARYYRKKQWIDENAKMPTICVNLENNIRTEYVSEFFKEKDGAVRLHVFGADSHTFSEEMLLDRNLWKAARMLHKGLRETGDLSLAYWSEYERRSSIASAAHASWHVESLKEEPGISTSRCCQGSTQSGSVQLRSMAAERRFAAAGRPPRERSLISSFSPKSTLNVSIMRYSSGWYLSSTAGRLLTQ